MKQLVFFLRGDLIIAYVHNWKDSEVPAHANHLCNIKSVIY